MAAVNRRQLLLLLLLRRRIRRRKLKNKYKKKFWIRKIFAERKLKGEFHCLIQDLKLFDHEFFFTQFRMLPSKFEELLSWVAPKITKSTIKRDPIGPEERLCVTLRYIVTGDAQVTIAASYRISQASIGRIIKETTAVIWDVLMEKGFLKAPETEYQWKKVALSFEEKWNFPHCVGAIDGKHIVIQAPAKSGSLFFNYKKTFSIVLLAVCNSDYEFTMVDIGEAGRQSDGGVFANSNIGFSIVNDLLAVPQPDRLEGTNIVFPYVFVGGDAFPLRYNLIKPYSNTVLNLNEIIANYRICRARRIIENTFGILAARFRIFRRPILAKVETVESITKACVALHNYLMKDRFSDGNSLYCPQRFVDTEIHNRRRTGQWRGIVHYDTGLQSVRRVGSNNYSKDAKTVRDNFRDYVNSPAGQVPWQMEMISVTCNGQ